MSRDALIVGVSCYQHLPNLKAPFADAEAIAQRLEKDSGFKIRRMPEHIIRIEDGSKRAKVSSTQEVTQLQLKQALKQLFLPDSHQIPETALFYFSGHGLASDEGYDKGYIATSDTVSSNPTPGLPLGWLHWLLSESPVRQQVIWLDCCHSGSLIVDMNAANPGRCSDRNRCFIASSRDFESSWEDLNSPYSVLTKAILEGLEPNQLISNSVNSFDLVAHISRALEGELQTPVCTSFGEAIDLTRSWQVMERKSETTDLNSDVCPYKGLEYFDWNNEDPKYFFGREQLVNKLIDHVRSEPFLALVGASGNGKSSVLRAGLLYQLKLGKRIVDSEHWQILITRPDAQPMRNLAAAFIPENSTQLDRAEALGRAEGLLREGSVGLQRLVEASSSPRTLLVIDQFEEVFTQCNQETERLEFFECLMGALPELENKLCLVIVMRSDFVGKCLAQDYVGLAQRVQKNIVSVLPLTEEELKSVIYKPAEKIGLSVDPDLVTVIVEDTKGAPGSLPLLQYTLKSLWQRKVDGRLRLSDYLALGGLKGTLNQKATDVYHRLDDTEKRTVQHIFQQLTHIEEGTEDTRRRVFIENLIAEPLHSAQQVQSVVNTLSNSKNRLLVTSEVVGKGENFEHRAIVDVAHEALIRHWQLLRQWIEQNRDLLRQQRRIEASAAIWQDQEQSRGYLLQGIPLTEAIQLRKRQSDALPLSESAKVFIQKSARYRIRSRLKTVSWLFIPATLLISLVEYNVREAKVKSDYVSLASSQKYEQRQAAQDLVAGCFEKKRLSVFSTYLAERFFGNCRSLEQVNLSESDLTAADLRSANLRDADLRSAELSATFFNAANLSFANLFRARIGFANFSNANLYYAQLTGTNLLSANLTSANLNEADLSFARLRDADLKAAELRSSILFTTDLRSVKNLTSYQLTGEDSPLICNSPLPTNVDIEGGMDRDCHIIAKTLFSRDFYTFESLEEAETFVAEERRKGWN